MNYRHAFHAGNFADVIKHIVLTRVLSYLHEKPAAFRVVDTHAGAGRYDLTGDEAQRSGEWRHGIAKLLAASLDAAPAALIKPYLDIVRSFNAASDGGGPELSGLSRLAADRPRAAAAAGSDDRVRARARSASSARRSAAS